jgi:hypothetical protein
VRGQGKLCIPLELPTVLAALTDYKGGACLFCIIEILLRNLVVELRRRVHKVRFGDSVSGV